MHSFRLRHFARRPKVVFATLLGLVLLPSSLPAQVWDGGNGTTSWQDAGNWDPDGLPGNNDIATLDASFTTAALIRLLADVSFSGGGGGLNGLTITDGFDLDTNGFFLHVDDATETALTEVFGIGSSLIVKSLTSDPTMFSVDTDRLNVRNDGIVSVQGGRMKVDTDAEVAAAGRISGYGEIRFGDATSSGTVLDNRGVISVSKSLFAVGGILTLATANNAPAGTTLSLSGSTGTGSLVVNDGVGLGALRLIVDGETEDFEGTLDIGSFDTAEFVDDFSLLGGQIDFNGVNGVATLTGTGAVGSVGGSLNVNSGTARIDNALSLGIASFLNLAANTSAILSNTFSADSSATIDVGSGATIQFDGAASVIDAESVDFLLRSNSRLVVHGDLTVDAGTTANFDWDGLVDNADTVVDGPSAQLSIIADSIDPVVDGHDSDLTITNGGRMRITKTDVDNTWLKNGNLTLSSSAGGPMSTLATLNNGVAIYDANIAATGDGISVIDGEHNEFYSTSTVNVDAGATLRVKNAEIFGGAWGSGNGTVQNSVDMSVFIGTTMDFDVVDLDGPVGEANVILEAPLTITADRISENTSNTFGQFNGVPTTATLTVDDSARLEVQLNDPQDHWTIGENAIVGLLASAFGTEHFAGSDLRINGTVLQLGGDSQWASHVTLGASAEVNVPAGTFVTLKGGTIAKPNRIEGALISGGGQLKGGPNTGLQGFGTIETEINFPGTNRVLLAADQGELIVNGPITDVGTLGTANAGGTLRLGQAFNTSVADTALQLAGGSVTGLAVTNDGTTRGFGRITTQQFSQNATGTTNATGGLLTIDVAATQVDVSQGTLLAVNGDLEFRDPLANPFRGLVTVGTGHVVDFQGGWTLAGNAAVLNLNGGLTQQAIVGGTTTVQDSAVVNVSQNASFRNRVTLGSLARISLPNANDVLHLNGDAEIPFLGAQTAIVQGNGRIVNETNSTLDIAHGVNTVLVNLTNEGQLVLEDSAPGTVGLGRNFTQGAGGELKMELQGIGSGDFDRLSVIGTANLDGTLDVSLLGGFAPRIDDVFEIIAAAGGVVGQFDSQNLPTFASAIALEVVYDTSTVYLDVVSLPDFNNDAVLNCADIDSLVAEIAGGTNNVAFDLTGDASVDGDDLVQWLEDAGAVNLASGNSYLRGDANLDGFVDGSDFGIWNANKFTATAAWCSGDFSADGFVDGSDFGVWNSNKFLAADAGGGLVPEPTSLTVVGALLLLIGSRRKRCATWAASEGSPENLPLQISR